MTFLLPTEDDTMDTVFIQGLQLHVVIGVFQWEQHMKQTVILDVRAATDIRHASQSDRIEHTVDYKAMAYRLKEFAQSKPFALLETLGEQLAALVLQEFPSVAKVKIELNKPYAVRHARTVGVIIKRVRESAGDD